MKRASAAEVAKKYHDQFIETYKKLDISWDLFTATSTENHIQASQWFFTTLLKNGYITSRRYCSRSARTARVFTRRYVEASARCVERREPAATSATPAASPSIRSTSRSEVRLCGTKPEFKETEHFFLRLSAFQDKLLDWLKDKDYWRLTSSFYPNYLKAGSRTGRSPATSSGAFPFRSMATRTSAYTSGSRRSSAITRPPENGRSARASQRRGVISGESIDEVLLFHRQGQYRISHDYLAGHADGRRRTELALRCPANEFLNLESRKFSKSRHWAVYLPDYLSRYSAEPLRYLLSANMPETETPTSLERVREAQQRRTGRHLR